MTVSLPWEFGTVVYLRTREDRVKGFVTGYSVAPGGNTVWVSWPDTTETKHYDFELTTEYVPDFGGDS